MNIIMVSFMISSYSRSNDETAILRSLGIIFYSNLFKIGCTRKEKYAE